eukprot:gene4566-4490_t
MNESVDFIHYRGPATATAVARRIAAAVAPALVGNESTTDGAVCSPRPDATWAAKGVPNGACNASLNSSNAAGGEGTPGNGTCGARDAQTWAVALAALAPALLTEAAVLAAPRLSAGAAAPL